MMVRAAAGQSGYLYHVLSCKKGQRGKKILGTAALNYYTARPLQKRHFVSSSAEEERVPLPRPVKKKKEPLPIER